MSIFIFGCGMVKDYPVRKRYLMPMSCGLRADVSSVQAFGAADWRESGVGVWFEASAANSMHHRDRRCKKKEDDSGSRSVLKLGARQWLPLDLSPKPSVVGAAL